MNNRPGEPSPGASEPLGVYWASSLRHQKTGLGFSAWCQAQPGLGLVVTSSWLQVPDIQKLDFDPRAVQAGWKQNLRDLEKSKVLLLYEGLGDYSAGAHIEAGWMLGRGKPVWYVGVSRPTWISLPAVQRWKTLEALTVDLQRRIQTQPVRPSLSQQ